MELNKQVFYHIKKKNSCTNDWCVGNEFDWNSRANEFIKNLYEMDLRMPTDIGNISYRKAVEYLMSKDVDYRNQKLFNYYNFGNFALNKTSMILREVIIENHRKEYYPNLPSRANCIWVCEKTSIDYWVKSLQIQEYELFKLRLTGSSHQASEKNLISDVLNFCQYSNMAEEYWKQNQSCGLDSEIIFDGHIEILEKCKF
jgi:hypothetical protein